MKKHYISRGGLLASYAAILFATACNQKELVEEQPQSVAEPSAHIISRVQADKIAIKSLALIVGDRTKSITPEIKSSEVVRNVATRSESGSDTLLYVVNFENEAGFAIIAADNRTEPLLAISDEGNFDWQAANNSDARYVTESLVEYQSYAIASRNRPVVGGIDHLNPPPTGFKPDFYEYSDWYTDKTRGKPFMIKTKWSQRTPCNDYIYSGDWPAGCTIIAAAQIMAYQRYPKSHDGYTYNWSNVLSEELLLDNEDVKRFVYMVFDHMPGKTLVNLGSTKSVAVYLHYVRGLLSDLGYSNAWKYQGMDINTMASSIYAGYPVCVQGNVPGDLTNAHTWVMDGYLFRSQDINGYKMFNGVKNLVSTSTISLRYFHCNWGWAGLYDGYFSEGVFDARKGSLDNNTLSPQKSGSSYDYSANVKMITHIKP